MAKGIPLMGRDPDGKAKVINVDENGNVKVQLKGRIVSSGTTLDDADSVGNGTAISLSGGQFVEFDVSGTFEGTVVFYERYPGNVDRRLFVVKVNNESARYGDIGLMMRSTTEPGRYYAFASPGAKSVFARLQGISSGSVTVTVHVSASDEAALRQLLDTPRHVQVFGVGGVEVAPGKSKQVASDLYVAQFPYLYALCQCDKNHKNWEVAIQQRVIRSDVNMALMPEVVLIDSATAAGDAQRKYSEWYESRGQQVSIYINNNETVDTLTFDLVLFGVR